MAGESFKNSVPRALIKTFALMFVGLFLFGVIYTAYDFLGNTRFAPSKADLTGRYVPDEATAELLTHGNTRYRGLYFVQLNGDGSYETGDVPIEQIPSSGMWEVHRSQESADWRLVMKDRGNVANVNLRGQSAPYSIRIYTGDPDANQYLTLVRKSEK